MRHSMIRCTGFCLIHSLSSCSSFASSWVHVFEPITILTACIVLTDAESSLCDCTQSGRSLFRFERPSYIEWSSLHAPHQTWFLYAHPRRSCLAKLETLGIMARYCSWLGCTCGTAVLGHPAFAKKDGRNDSRQCQDQRSRRHRCFSKLGHELNSSFHSGQVAEHNCPRVARITATAHSIASTFLVEMVK